MNFQVKPRDGSAKRAAIVKTLTAEKIKRLRAEERRKEADEKARCSTPLFFLFADPWFLFFMLLADWRGRMIVWSSHSNFKKKLLTLVLPTHHFPVNLLLFQLLSKFCCCCCLFFVFHVDCPHLISPQNFWRCWKKRRRRKNRGNTWKR